MNHKRSYVQSSKHKLFSNSFFNKTFCNCQDCWWRRKQRNSRLVKFFSCKDGVLVLSEISNLPKTETNFFAIHIHENGECDGDFSFAGGHYGEGTHPLHSGDLPPLLSASGTATSLVLTNRFTPSEIIGKSVIIHDGYDDFTTQPSGNSGARIACGVIKKT